MKQIARKTTAWILTLVMTLSLIPTFAWATNLESNEAAQTFLDQYINYSANVDKPTADINGTEYSEDKKSFTVETADLAYAAWKAYEVILNDDSAAREALNRLPVYWDGNQTRFEDLMHRFRDMAERTIFSPAYEEWKLHNAGFGYMKEGTEPGCFSIEFTGLTNGEDYTYSYNEETGILEVTVMPGAKSHWLDAYGQTEKELFGGIYFDLKFYTPTDATKIASACGQGIEGIWEQFLNNTEWSSAQKCDGGDSGIGHQNARRIASVNREENTVTISSSSGAGEGEHMALSWFDDAGENLGRYMMGIRVNYEEEFSYDFLEEPLPQVSDSRISETMISGAENWVVTKQDGLLSLRPISGKRINELTDSNDQDLIGHATLKAPADGYSIDWDKSSVQDGRRGNGNELPLVANGQNISTTYLTLVWTKSGEADIVEELTVKVTESKTFMADIWGGKAKAATAAEVGKPSNQSMTVSYDEQLGYVYTSFAPNALPTVAELNEGVTFQPPEGAVSFRFTDFGGNRDNAYIDQTETKTWEDALRNQRIFDLNNQEGCRHLTFPYVETDTVQVSGLTVYFAATQLYRARIVEWLDKNQNSLGYSYVYGKNGSFVNTVNTEAVAAVHEAVETPTIIANSRDLHLTCNRYLQEGGHDSWYFRLMVDDESKLDQKNGNVIYLPYSYFGNLTWEEAQNRQDKPVIEHYYRGENYRGENYPEILEGEYTEYGVRFTAKSFSPYVVKLSGQGSNPGGDSDQLGENQFRVCYNECFSEGESSAQRAFVKVGETTIPSNQPQGFTTGTPITFVLQPEPGETAKPIVEIVVFDGNEDQGNTWYHTGEAPDSSHYLAISNGPDGTYSVTFTPNSVKPFEIRVFWSERDLYDSFGYNSDEEVQLRYRVRGPVDVEMNCGDYHRGQVGYHNEGDDFVYFKQNLVKTAESVQVTIHPGENAERRTITLNGQDVLLDNNSFTWSRDDFGKELTVVYAGPEPDFRVESRGAAVEVSGAEKVEERGNGVYLYAFNEGAKNAVVTITGGHGVRLGSFVKGGEQNNPSWSWIKPVDGTCKVTLPNDSSKFYEIIVMDREPIVYDNEFVLSYERYDDFTVKLNGETLTPWETVKTFEAGNTLEFVCSEVPYKVLVRENDAEDKEIEISGNSSFTYTPASNAGFELRVYQTEKEYSFDTIPCDWDNQFIAEYQVRFDGCEPNAGCTVTYDVTPVASRSYDGRTRLVLAKDITQVKLTITAAEDYVYEVWVNRQEVTADDVVDGVYTWTVGENSDIWPEIVFRSETGNPGEGGGGNTPRPEDYAGAKDYIEGWDLAYYGGTDDQTRAETVKNLMATELWNEGFCVYNGHTGDYTGMFADFDTFKSKFALGSLQEASDQNPLNLPYYEYTVALNESVEATGKVYVLESPDDFVVATTVGRMTTYTVTTVTYDTVDGHRFANDCYVQANFDYDAHDEQIRVFGNGVCAVGSLEVASEGGRAYHITQEHSGLGDDGVIGNLGTRLIVVQNSFVGVKISGQRSAASWDFVDTNVYEASADENLPFYADIYYGNDSVQLQSLFVKTITGIETAGGLSAGVIDVSGSAGVYQVSFLSAYDVIPLKISFADDSAAYLTLNRVGLDIHDPAAKDEDDHILVWHGTDHTVAYSGTADKAIYASFYASSAPATNLFVTVRYTDETVQTKVISADVTQSGKFVTSWQPGENNGPDVPVLDENAQVGVASQGSDKHYADYLLWSGSDTELNKIESISVFAYTPGDANTFGGVKVGSGAGVTWTNEAQ